MLSHLNKQNHRTTTSLLRTYSHKNNSAKRSYTVIQFQTETARTCQEPNKTYGKLKLQVLKWPSTCPAEKKIAVFLFRTSICLWLPYLFEYNAHLNCLVENWYMDPNKNVTSENTELKLAMLKLNTTFLLQRRCRPCCCNILYYYIIEPK